MKIFAILIAVLCGIFLLQQKGQAMEKIDNNNAVAIFAGGCFWCMEKPFDHVPGVISTTSGYTGGHTDNPTYEQVSAGETGHKEALQVVYNPKQVTYSQLLDVFWHNIDPFDANGQFCDKGDQYQAAIFYSDAMEQKLAQDSKDKLETQFKQKIVTAIMPAAKFYPAEGYHQDYYQKNPIRYKFYRGRCGRDERLQEIWQ